MTGSGRLDVFRKGGDSLAGRYFMFHLFPFTISELTKKKDMVIPKKSADWLNGVVPGNGNEKESASTWEILFNLGGFPEPFLKGSADFYNLWTQTYIQQVIREEVRNFSDVNNIDTIDKSEVDFLVAEKNQPLLLIEAKASQETPSKNLYHFRQVLDVPAVQLVNKEGIYKKIKNGSNYIYIVSGHRWLSGF